MLASAIFQMEIGGNRRLVCCRFRGHRVGHKAQQQHKRK